MPCMDTGKLIRHCVGPFQENKRKKSSVADDGNREKAINNVSSNARTSPQEVVIVVAYSYSDG